MQVSRQVSTNGRKSNERGINWESNVYAIECFCKFYSFNCLYFWLFHISAMILSCFSTTLWKLPFLSMNSGDTWHSLRCLLDQRLEIPRHMRQVFADREVPGHLYQELYTSYSQATFLEWFCIVLAGAPLQMCKAMKVLTPACVHHYSDVIAEIGCKTVNFRFYPEFYCCLCCHCSICFLILLQQS